MLPTCCDVRSKQTKSEIHLVSISLRCGFGQNGMCYYVNLVSWRREGRRRVGPEGEDEGGRNDIQEGVRALEEFGGKRGGGMGRERKGDINMFQGASN